MTKIKRTDITDLSEKHLDTVVMVCGWIRSHYSQKHLIFMKLIDSYKIQSVLQVVVDMKSKPGYFEPLRHVGKGCTVKIIGKFVASPKPKQPFELQAHEFEILGTVADPASYPLALDEVSLDTLRSFPQLESRHPTKACIYGIRSEIMKATQKFFDDHKFVKADMPLITFSECEGGCQPMQVTLLLTSGKHTDIPRTPILGPDGKETGEYTDDVHFKKDFFGAKSLLTVSAQLELETLLPMGDLWTITRAVRGEPSMTTRHLTEFSMLEIEIRFTESAVDIIDISEEYIKFVIAYILTHCPAELAYLQSTFGKSDMIAKLQDYVDQPFVRITHAKAVELMLSQPPDTFSELPKYTDDLGSEHEKWLADVHFKRPVVVMRYPKAVKAFYMPVVVETEEESHGVEHVDSFDILVPEAGELVGGSQRIHKLDELEQRIDELGLDRKPLEFYVDLRRYGTMPHGGMGLGIERLVRFITGAPSVKDCVSFPRFISCAK